MPATPSAVPRHPHVGVIALVNEPWSERWQPRHQILSRMAREYHVLWLTPAHEWRESLGRMRAGPTLSSPESAGSLVVYRPETWLPKVYRPLRVAHAIFRARLVRARAELRRRGCTQIVLSLWGPDHASALDAIAHDASCYHIDDEYTFGETATATEDANEIALLGRVDGVFMHSATVYARKAIHCRHAAITHNGVDFDALATPVAMPGDLLDIPRPILGYTGYVKRQLDWALVLEIARAHREWSFVFVGARSPHPDIATTLDALAALPNVHMLGAKTTRELTRYPQHFDVCLLPYRVTDYTNAIDPLKLGEYMAAGRPAVGSAIAPLIAAGDLISVARTQQEWEACIAQSLLPTANTGAEIARRQTWARARSWEASVATITEFVNEVLTRPATIAPPHVQLATD